jgi:hypothetical protein
VARRAGAAWTCGGALLLVLAVAAALGGCGAGSATTTTAAARPDREAPAASAPHRAVPAPSRERRPEETVAPSRCPSGHPSCRTTEGRLVYVERVDPDGDGDAHFVVLDGQGITLPGLTAIDVRVGLRPHPLPGPGDLISAAGPVQTGSYGQSQIHALELHVGAP